MPSPPSPTRAPAGHHEAARPGRLRLVHVTTVPQTLLFLSGQSAYLRARGIDVVAVSSPGDALRRFGEQERVPCHAIRMERAISPLRDLVALARLVACFVRLRPDVVDAHTPKGGLLGMVAAWLAGVPVRVYHVHGLRFTTATGLRRRVLRATERVAAALATRVLVVSPSVAAAAAEEALFRPGRTRVLLGGSINGVDAAGRFRPAAPGERRAARASLGIPEDAEVIGFVGRLCREKGLAELAEAWRALREEHPRAHLVLVGEREPQDPLPAVAAALLDGDPRVHAAGFAWDVPRHLRAMDLVALPSWREGFPVVPLEAAAMGLPVVATRVAGCVDAVVDGVTGALVPARDAGALAAALGAYLRDPSLRARHGAAGRERVLRDFEQARLWQALHEEYVALAAAAARPRGRGAEPAAGVG